MAVLGWISGLWFFIGFLLAVVISMTEDVNLRKVLAVLFAWPFLLLTLVFYGINEILDEWRTDW